MPLDWIELLCLGVVQGLTEFLPISSDGHLTLCRNLFDVLFGREADGEVGLFVIVLLHLGTLAAILVYYRESVRLGWLGLLGRTHGIPSVYHRRSLIRTALLVVLATLPAVFVGLFLKSYVEQAFQGTTAAGIGFLVTAAVLLATPRHQHETARGPEAMTWVDALLIGVAQAFAPLPGVSRSGLTIAAALGLGLERTWAVGFSLLMAVPAILGAEVLELKDVNPRILEHVPIGPLIAGTIVAGLVGYLAIVWLVRIVRRGRLRYFSIYLILLGLTVLLLFPAKDRVQQGGTGDVPSAQALDRPLRDGLPGGLVRS